MSKVIEDTCHCMDLDMFLSPHIRMSRIEFMAKIEPSISLFVTNIQSWKMTRVGAIQDWFSGLLFFRVPRKMQFFLRHPWIITSTIPDRYPLDSLLEPREFTSSNVARNHL